jgi:hypothetical protein
MTTYGKDVIEKIIKMNNGRVLLPEHIIKDFQDKIEWWYITRQTLSEDFIREFQDKFDKNCWEGISAHQKLSEDFIREFQDKVDWKGISISQQLTEDFIREFQDKVNWTYILSKQKNISENFKNEFYNKLNPPSDTEESCSLLSDPSESSDEECLAFCPEHSSGAGDLD